jgi:F0F1-type ATP synthase assembly protein I
MGHSPGQHSIRAWPPRCRFWGYARTCSTQKIVIKFAIGSRVGGEPNVLKAPTPEEREQLATAGMAWGMGCSIVVSILGSVLGGLFLDKVTDQTPLFTLIGVGLGMFLAGYQLWELVQAGAKDGKVGPVARRVAKAQSIRQQRRTRQQ